MACAGHVDLGAPRIFVGSSGLESIASADLNNDGYPDLVATSIEPGFDVYLNDGRGAFTVMRFTTQSAPLSVVTGDFDRDGHIDVAYLEGGDARVAVYLNSGNGVFTTPATFSTGPLGGSYARGRRLAAVDLDGDQILDLIAADFGGNMPAFSVLHGIGDGSFAPYTTQTFALSGSVPSLDTGDVNGDGRTDLAFVTLDQYTSTQNVHIARGNGDGTFQTPSSLTATTGWASNFVLLRDLDGDGDLDLLRHVDGAMPMSPRGLEVFKNKNGVFGTPAV